MTCRDFADFLADYIANDLPPDILSAFEAHIAVCPNCVRYLAQYRDSIAMGQRAFANMQGSVSDDVPEDLISAILIARGVWR